MNTPIPWLNRPAQTPNKNARQAAQTRQAQLTKPPGALGQLENVAIQLAALQGVERPLLERVNIAVFAGDHGVTEENISAFPQAVTAEMVKNFARGGAAICVAAKMLKAHLQVINLGTAFDTGALDNVTTLNLGLGTANFTAAAAMTDTQLDQALSAGKSAAQQVQDNAAHLFIGGEMGIGNTTSAAALACALLHKAPAELAGAGTGLDATGITHKISVIERALAYHQPHLKNTPQEVLRRLGGFEIAALVGATIACAQQGIPVLVDGFIGSAAALVAIRINPSVHDWLLFSHTSAEAGHRIILNALNAQPLLDLGLRLGEGSGAAVAVPLLRMACALHNGMATFAEAEVSEKK